MTDEERKNIHVKPRTCLSINITILRLLGIWFPEEENKTWRTRFYVIYAIFTQGIVYYSYMLSEFINLLTVFGDIEKMAESSYLLLTHIAQIWKVYCFTRYSIQMVKFLDELELPIFTPKNENQWACMRWAMSRGKSDSVTLLSMAVATCSCWAIFPFVEKQTDVIRLPLPGWYPFDTNNITNYRNFVYVYIYQIIGGTLNALTNIAMDTTATGLFIHICGQIDMLKDSLQYMKRDAILSIKKKKSVNMGNELISVENESDFNFNNVEDNSFTHQELENEMIKVFRDCVVHHSEIIRYAADVEELFNMCFLAQFSASVVIICLTMFKITMVETIFSIEFLGIGLYQSCIVFELLLYCWHGNEMILKSDSLSNSVYNSAWYEFSPKFSKNIIMLMVRSKRPIRATSGKFFFLSLSTFTGILRLSWSYFAVLNSMHEE